MQQKVLVGCSVAPWVFWLLCPLFRILPYPITLPRDVVIFVGEQSAFPEPIKVVVPNTGTTGKTCTKEDWVHESDFGFDLPPRILIAIDGARRSLSTS